MQETITITFGDHAENGVGMQIIGNTDMQGISCEKLRQMEGPESKYYSVSGTDEAGVLVIRNGVGLMGIDPDELLKEQKSYKWDKKALMKGRVVNKKARHNICYADFSQKPAYKEGRGDGYEFLRFTLTQRTSRMYTSRLSFSI
jgi:hypothetical protein